MKLNIHLMSHPILKNLSSLTINKVSSPYINNQLSKQLSIFVIYETIRNWLKIYPLTIKQINNQKRVTIIDPKESFTLILDSFQDLIFFQDIRLILPNMKFKLIDNSNLNSTKNSSINLPDIDSYTKIIIITREINSKYVLTILNYLTKQQNININQIRLTCITCKSDQLLNISKQYTNLNIYTTNIINA